MSKPPSPLTCEHIGDQIRQRRLAMGLSQNDFVARAALGGQSQLSAWENGHKCPELLSLYRLAEVFGCTVHDLIPPEELFMTRRRR